MTESEPQPPLSSSSDLDKPLTYETPSEATPAAPTSEDPTEVTPPPPANQTPEEATPASPTSEGD
jgi:hypothetical protein